MPLQVFCRNCAQYRNEWCKLKVDSPDPDMVRDCQYYRGMTNADRIRSMTDEDLAEYHAENCGCALGESLFCGNRMETIGCVRCWLDWLKQEVEE